MAALRTNQPQFFSDICDEIRLFFPVKKIENADECQSDIFCVHADLFENENIWNVICSLNINGERVSEHSEETSFVCKNKLEYKKLKKRFLKNGVYALLKKYTGKTPPWGSLTGIRPTKLTRELETIVDDPYKYIMREFDVSKEKAELARIINNAQRPYICDIDDNSIDIYIGIPFCKSRCYYCSFISREYGRNEALKDLYLKKLFYETDKSSDIVRNYNIRCLYVGGGTPTALSAGELDMLLNMLDKAFPCRQEYTVEAGRPDTIDETKLNIMKDHGVTRISVNAQTTNDGTLKTIGRDYGARLYFDVFELARKCGFDNINSDIILGLPGECAKIMQNTLKDVLSVHPDNITVHTLAIKNSSYLADMPDEKYPAGDVVSAAVSGAFKTLYEKGYTPYYMYRQKYMSGNLENTGYSLPGKICMYNIDNMEETVSVLALGAGGISKRVFKAENRIERACNVKDIMHYCERVDEMVSRKEELFSD